LREGSDALTSSDAGMPEIEFRNPPAEARVMKTYDVRSVIDNVIRYRLRSSRRITQTVNPFRVSEAQEPSSGFREVDDAVDDLRMLIESNVDTDSWHDNGGSVGALKEWGGYLLVLQTPATHEKVANMLKAMRDPETLGKLLAANK
jgi:hypothetical protein